MIASAISIRRSLSRRMPIISPFSMTGRFTTPQFTIRLTPTLVGGDVEELLDTLTKGGQLPFVPTDSWKIEPAKSSRSKCNTCGTGIAQGALRVGEPSFFQDHKSFKWHHFECIADHIWKIPEEMLEGYSELDSSVKEVVRRKLWS